MNYNRIFRCFKSIALLFFVLLVSVKPLLADFELLDSIKEFGEKRFFAADSTPHVKFKSLRVYPTLKTKVEYDSNILLEDRDVREDVIFSVRTGVVLELPINKHQVVVGYEADIQAFSKERHHQQNDQNQNFFTLADLQFPSWYVNVLERFSETSSRSGTTFTGRIPRYEQEIYPKIGYRFGRFIFETGFRHFVRDFRRQVDDLYDFQEVEWTNTLYYDLFARLKLLLDYQIAQIDYDDSYFRNGTFHQARIGVVGELYPNVLLKAAIGPHFRNYETSSKPDFYSWVANMQIEYQIREKIKLKAGFERLPLEATFLDVNAYVRHQFSTGVEYQIHPQWKTFSDLKLYRDNYQERVTYNSRTGFRRDNQASVDLGVLYQAREWLHFELMYEYLRRNSNFSSLDYTDNRVSLTSSLAY